MKGEPASRVTSMSAAAHPVTSLRCCTSPAFRTIVSVRSYSIQSFHSAWTVCVVI